MTFTTYYREAAEALWFISAMQSTETTKEHLRKLAKEYERLAQEDEKPQPPTETYARSVSQGTS